MEVEERRVQLSRRASPRGALVVGYSPSWWHAVEN
jgi:hypothetical protein